MLVPKEERKLVSRSLAGDTQAYSDLVEAFGRPVFSLLLRLTANQADCEDLAQEVFLRAYKSLHTYNPDRPFLNWILAIAHNAGIDCLKKRSRAPISLDDETSPFEVMDAAADTGAMVERRFEAEAVWRAISQLPPLQREALLLRHKDCLEYQSIADIMGLSLAGVKTLIHRGRIALRSRLMETETFQPPSQ